MISPTEFVKNKVNCFKDQILSKMDEYRYEVEKKANEAGEDESLKVPRDSIKASASSSEDHEGKELSSDDKRENLQRNFELKEPGLEDLEKSRQTSQLHSQGVADHSGSPVHGAGQNMDGKTNASMWQRNFNNHQGN